MNRIILAVMLTLSLLLGAAGSSQAQKSSGKSYSSGSSGSRSSSSSSGKSYSSGSKSSSPSSSGKSYSSGSSKPSTGSKPSPSFPSSSTSGKSYSSGSSKPPASSASPSTSSRPPFSNSPPSSSSPTKGKSYSSGDPSGRSTSSGKSYTTGSDPGSRKPGASTSYDRPAGSAQAKEESRAAYTQGQAPKSSYTTPRGDARTIDPKDTQIEDLRRQLDHERWSNRSVRQRRYFEPYYSRPVVVYDDPYSSSFWFWLLDQSLDRRAYWAYHHRSRMDDARYRDMLARDAQLEARVRQLEAEKVARDPSWSFDGGSFDPDLMYTDEYVDAAYNPQQKAPPAAVQPSRGAACGQVIRTLLIILLVLGIIWLLIWLVFIKRWGST